MLRDSVCVGRGVFVDGYLNTTTILPTTHRLEEKRAHMLTCYGLDMSDVFSELTLINYGYCLDTTLYMNPIVLR